MLMRVRSIRNRKLFHLSIYVPSRLFSTMSKSWTWSSFSFSSSSLNLKLSNINDGLKSIRKTEEAFPSTITAFTIKRKPRKQLFQTKSAIIRGQQTCFSFFTYLLTTLRYTASHERRADEAVAQLDKPLDELYDWCILNRLTTHPEKAKLF